MAQNTPEFEPHPPLSPKDLADHEGHFDDQLALPLQVEAEPRLFDTIVKRNGLVEPFDKQKIAAAIFKAAESVGGQDRDLAENLASAVTIFLSKRLRTTPPAVDQVHDAVERVLIQMSHARTALAYARYRDRRGRIRRLREGDMRALLSELVEAQHSPDALAKRRDHALLVRTQNDSATWNRERIVEALVREAGLDKPASMMIALEVEQQIEQAGLHTLTASLVRELVGAKLIEHGLEAYREPYRRLGMSVYDCGRILRGATESTMATDPETTDRVIAWAAKREYALTEVYSAEVAEAHYHGALHVHYIERVDRLLGIHHDLRDACQTQWGAHGGTMRLVPPEDGDQVLPEILRWHGRHERFVSAWAAWPNFNYFAAPYLKLYTTAAITQFAQRIAIDFAYHGMISQSETAPARLELHWTVPEELACAEAVHSGSGLRPAVYSDLEHPAQRLAWSLVEHVRNAAAEGIRTPSPGLVCVLGPSFIQADGSAGFLNLAAEAAAEGAPLHFRFDRPGAAAPRFPVAHQVTVNLPRLAYQSRNDQDFIAEFDRVLNLAFSAHEEKFAFLSVLMDPRGQGPLRALTQGGETGLRPEDCQYHVALDGLFECLHFLHGGHPAQKPEGVRFAEQILRHGRERCAAASARLGLPIVLAENADPATGARFASLDLASYPGSVRATLPLLQDGAELRYTPGVGLPPLAGVAPVEQCRLESRFKTLLDHPEPCLLHVPMRHTDARSIADAVQKCARLAECPGIRFQIDG